MPHTSTLHRNPSFCIVANDFTAYDRQYREKLAAYYEKLQQASQKLRQLDARGMTTNASQQLFIHAKWLTRYTAYWSRLDALLERLEDSFFEHDQRYVAQQSPEDGSWGWHYREFHHKFDATIGRLHELEAQQTPPQYALDFLEPVSTVDKMVDYLERLRTSDIAETGRNQRDEFGAVLTCLGQICFKPKLREFVQRHVKGIQLDQKYVDAFEAFLDQSQNPETGYWGPWYRSKGRVYRYDDLSFTFHLISYRKGRVNHWPQIIDTTFATKAKAYPRGWLHNGRYNNHNNYDVAKIFRFAWPHMTVGQQAQTQKEVQLMLDWCLNKSMESDGRFVTDSSFYNSTEACHYFGVSFLDEIGYFDPGRRFWTDRAFPESADVAERIRHQLGRLNPSHEQVTASRWKLENAIKSKKKTGLRARTKLFLQGLRQIVPQTILKTAA